MAILIMQTMGSFFAAFSTQKQVSETNYGPTAASLVTIFFL